MADNNVTITGSLGKDPELRFTAGGAGICSFSLAVNRRWVDKMTKEWQEEVSWLDVIAWGQLGENVDSSCTKGMRVTVVGRLQQRSWETNEGAKRSKVEVVADDVSCSLKWATAAVERITRDGPRGAAPSAPAAPAYDDESPF